MKAHLPHSLAALLAAGAMSLASAQTAPAVPAPSFVAEPVASASTTVSAPDQRVADVVQALNADASLRNSKITVQLDGANILLTGASMTQEQARRAGELAAQGGAVVINAIGADRFETQAAPAAAAAPQAAG